MLEGTFSKLKNDTWGGRIVGHPRPGETVLIRKKDGTAQEKIVARILWSDDNISLVAFGNVPAGGEGRPAARPVEPPPSRRRDDDDAPGYQPLPDDVLMALYAASWEGE